MPGFNHFGATYERVSYRGPDTGGAEILMPSRGAQAGLLDKPPTPVPSIWLLRIYSTSYSPIAIMPDPQSMTFVGQANVEFVKFRNQAELKALVPQAPNSKYAWVAYGSLRIKKAGGYTLCTQSDDGSYIFVDAKEVVENDGLHGAVNKCKTVTLSQGNHPIIVAGFQNEGGVYQDLSYRGPDTSNIYKPMRSQGQGGGSWAPADTRVFFRPKTCLKLVADGCVLWFMS